MYKCRIILFFLFESILAKIATIRANYFYFHNLLNHILHLFNTYNMCKMLAQSNYFMDEDDNLNETEDLRIHGQQYAATAENVYKACLAGIRRQRY